MTAAGESTGVASRVLRERYPLLKEKRTRQRLARNKIKGGNSIDGAPLRRMRAPID